MFYSCYRMCQNIYTCKNHVRRHGDQSDGDDDNSDTDADDYQA